MAIGISEGTNIMPSVLQLSVWVVEAGASSVRTQSSQSGVLEELAIVQDQNMLHVWEARFLLLCLCMVRRRGSQARNAGSMRDLGGVDASGLNVNGCILIDASSGHFWSHSCSCKIARDHACSYSNNPWPFNEHVPVVYFLA